jgi:GT2 family glycosyltransferase
MDRPALAVWAGVVAYDAPATLAACLGALAAQTHPLQRIVVIDNGSTPSAFPAAGVEVIRPETNTGPAGGFARGLARFLEGEAVMAWVMDDDVVPSQDALAHLVAQLDSRPAGIAFPLVSRHGAAPALSGPAWAGVLLPRPVVETVGLPDASLFYWTEDTEYLQWRIPRAGFPRYDAHRAIVDDRRVRRQAHLPPWGYYYRSRNSVHYRLRVQGGRHVLRLLPQLARLAARAAWEPGRGTKLTMVARGVADGLRGRLGPTILPPAGASRPASPGPS